MVRSWWGLLAAVFATVNSQKKKKDDKGEEIEGRKGMYFRRTGREELEQRTNKVIVTYILAAIQGLVLGIIVCPLGVLYMIGLYISAGVSLWRLIEHDFGDAGGANQKPALQVLYSLGVAQGVLFGYKTLHSLGARNRLAKFAAKHGTVDEELVAEYLEETVAECLKDPSFAIGRNLVTYGVHLMREDKSKEIFIAGIRVLDGAIKDDSWTARGRKVLAKHLLTRSDSWSPMIQRLLEIVGPRSPYSREVREHAVRIVALVARGIHLQQFPGMIECISCLLDTSAEESNQQKDSYSDWIQREYGENKLKYYQRVELLEEYELHYLLYDRKTPDSPDFSLSTLIQQLLRCLPCKRKKMEGEGKKNTVHGFDKLLAEAVNIIHQLAFDEDNRMRIVSNTVLQHKIAMAPLKLHRDNHDACSVSQKSELQMLEKCWVLMECLVATVKGTNGQGQIMKDAIPILEEGRVARSLVQAADPLLGGGRRNGDNIEEEEEGKGGGECLLQTMVGSALGNVLIDNIKTTIKSIFDCLDCGATQKKEGMQILLHLSLDMSFVMDSESRTRRLAWILVLVFLYTNDDSRLWMVSDFNRIRSLAGQKLSHMLRDKQKHDELPSEESVTELQLIRLALVDLTSAFSGDSEDISIRIHATIIMEGLCVCCNPFFEFAKEVEKYLLDVIPKVVKEILMRALDIEQQEIPTADGQEDISEDDDLESRMCRDGYMVNDTLRKALVSLCRGGYMEHYTLEPSFKEIASKICKKKRVSFEYFKSLLV